MESDPVITLLTLRVLRNLCLYVWVMMRRFSDMFSAEECYSENMSCWLKIIGSYCAGFDNLLAQTVIVGMRINIDATNSEETQMMPELMAAANYCSTCLLRQKNIINFGNVIDENSVCSVVTRKYTLRILPKKVINVRARDRDNFLTRVNELQGLY